jgi:hypothetical protein
VRLEESSDYKATKSLKDLDPEAANKLRAELGKKMSKTRIDAISGQDRITAPSHPPLAGRSGRLRTSSTRAANGIGRAIWESPHLFDEGRRRTHSASLSTFPGRFPN